MIKYGDSAFAVTSEFPSSWDVGAVTAITISVVKTDKTAILEDQAAVRWGGDTTSAAAEAGDDSIVLTTGTALTAGARVAVGSDAQGWQKRIVDSYTASTKTVVFTELLDEDLVSGSSVVGLDMIYVLDASTSAWDNISEVSVIWKPDSDDMPFKELWNVQSTESAGVGLEMEFSEAYPDLHSQITPGTFDMWRKRARNRLIQYFDDNERDFTKIVDSEITKEPMITQIAYLVGMGATISDQAWERIVRDLDMQLTRLDSLRIWIDDDEDETKDDGEEESAPQIGLSRGL
jgi:hypothetical protein